MAGIEQERTAFEAMLSRYVARMLEHAGRYVKQLDTVDKDTLLEIALEGMFSMRAEIKEGKDVLLVWDRALQVAARARPKWKTTDWFGVVHWVSGARLGK